MREKYCAVMADVEMVLTAEDVLTTSERNRILSGIVASVLPVEPSTGDQQFNIQTVQGTSLNCPCL